MAKERSVTREYLEAFLVAAIFLGFTNTFILKTFYIPSGSMENTLLVGDHLFVSRFIFAAAPASWEKSLLPVRSVRRGDIVIFRSPENPTLDLVKRCVGVPGDTIEVRDKELFVNGQPVEDSAYTLHRDPRIFPNLGPRNRHPGQNRDNFGPLVVPEDHYFCMGDNRDYSYDSRFWGPVPQHFLKGRALLIYWSNGGETPDGVWRGWGVRLTQLAKTTFGFLTQTRWKRTFRWIR